MEGQIPARIKAQRLKLAMAEQLKVARDISASFIGREMTVLAEAQARPGEGPAAAAVSPEHGLVRSSSVPGEWSRPGPGGRGRLWIARSQADAPGIDGRVYVRGRLAAGAFASVRIIRHTDYDLLAVPAA
jgi:tRNA A37 methylthiotransferase MiaB